VRGPRKISSLPSTLTSKVAAGSEPPLGFGPQVSPQSPMFQRATSSVAA